LARNRNELIVFSVAIFLNR